MDPMDYDHRRLFYDTPEIPASIARPRTYSAAIENHMTLDGQALVCARNDIQGGDRVPFASLLTRVMCDNVGRERLSHLESVVRDCVNNKESQFDGLLARVMSDTIGQEKLEVVRSCCWGRRGCVHGRVSIRVRNEPNPIFLQIPRALQEC
ncbi:hypothetical protein NXS19_004391 [Fusarium pseudograminearum]|nr:hypothetical protein NXS19_004391 [Fusarium pseudograminearum]